VRIDLHTHSAVSDGTQSPTELVRAAAAAGLDVLGLTDHDTSAGWGEAVEAASDAGVELVRGMEVSTTHRGASVHLLAYLPDPTEPDLVAMLERIVAGRDDRLPSMLDRLAGLGMPVTLDDVRRVSGPDAVPGRPHVADALVAAGHVADRTEAFDRYLADGGPAFVDRWAPELVDALDVVRRAGGATVVAHPWGRGREASLPEEDFPVLVEHGLAGIEVDHQDHVAPHPDVRDRLRRLAREHDLVVTGSSDHHGAGKVDHELGVHTTAPEEYERLIARAAAAAAAAGRDTPSVV